jgi:catechol 2,3-dioxygenase-like lactoylglutathione lyase family enzyme
MPGYRFDHIHLYTANPETTAQWYEKMFGAEVLRSTVDGKPRIDLKVGGADIFLLPVAQSPAGKNSLDHFGFLVDDVDAAIADLRAKGAKVTMEPNTIRPGTRISFVESPEGVRIEVLQRA